MRGWLPAATPPCRPSPPGLPHGLRPPGRAAGEGPFLLPLWAGCCRGEKAEAARKKLPGIKAYKLGRAFSFDRVKIKPGMGKERRERVSDKISCTAGEMMVLLVLQGGREKLRGSENTIWPKIEFL